MAQEEQEDHLNSLHKKIGLKPGQSPYYISAAQYSCDRGKTWHTFQLCIQENGMPHVASFNDQQTIPEKPRMLLRHANLDIPEKGIHLNDFTLKDKADLGWVEFNPDLPEEFLALLPWSEPFENDNLKWSDMEYTKIK